MMRELRQLLALGVLLGAAVSPVHAASKYWDRDGDSSGLQPGDATWDTGSTATWSTAAAGTTLDVWNDNDKAFFQTGGTNNVTLLGTVEALGIAQGGAGTVTTISGGTALHLGADGIDNNLEGANGAITVNTGIILTANQTWSTANTTGVSITVANVAGSAAEGGTHTLTIDLSSNAAGTITGTLSDGAAGGKLALTKSGSGALTLQAASSHSGGTTLSSGTLTIQHAGALGSGAVAQSGGTLINNTGGTVTLNNPFNITGNITLGGDTGNDWILTNVTLGTASGGNRNINVANNTTVTFSTALESTTNTLAKGAGGTLVLSTANNHAGTTLNGGLLVINHAGALGGGANLVIGGNGSFDNQTGATLTIAKGLQASGGSPTYAGSNPIVFTGEMTITGANRTFTVNGSSVTVNGISDSGQGRNFTKQGAGTLIVAGPSTYTGQTIVSTGTLQLNHVGALAGSVISLSGGTIFNNSGGTVTHNVPVVLPNSSGLTGGRFAFGTLTFTANNRTLTSDADVSFTRIELMEASSSSGRNTFLAGSGAITVTGEVVNGGTGPGVGNFTYQGTGTLNLPGTVSFGGAFTIQTGTGNLTGTVNGPSLVAVTSNGRINLSGTVVGDLNVGQGGGSASDGTLVIAPTGTVTGTLNLIRGVIANSSNEPVIIDSTLGTVTNLMTFGGAEYGSNGDIVFTNAFLPTNAFNITVHNRTTLAVQMNASGGAAFSVSGTGTLIFLGSNNATTTQTIEAGATLQVGDGGSAGSIGTGPITLNGDLVWNKSDATILANAITGDGSLTKRGEGTLTLTGAKAYTGGTVIEAGKLTAASLGSGDVLLSATGAQLELTSATAIDDAATLTLPAGSVLQLNFGSATESVGLLNLGGTIFGPGTVFSFENDYLGHAAYFAGSDVQSSLQVIPEPGSLAVLGLALPLMLRRRRALGHP